MSRWALAEGEAVEAGPMVTVFLRLERDADGTVEVREAAMTGDGSIDAATWRDVPFDAVKLVATAPWLYARLGLSADEWFGGRGFTLGASLATEFGPVEEPPTSVLIGGTSLQEGRLGMLKAPHRNLTDEFLSDLAGVYLELVAAKRNPAPVIADQTGAPVATVRRWVAVARKRGFLQPATKGRAG